MTSEYMAILENAPRLKATDLTGDYRILADFGDAVLAGHPTERGVQFVSAVAVSGIGQVETPQSLATPAFAGLSPVAESGTKAALTTCLTTDRKIFQSHKFCAIMVQNQISGYSAVGSALDLGSRGRAFESLYSDQNPSEIVDFRGIFLILCLLRRKIYGYIVECRLKNMSKNHIISLQIFLQT